MIAELLVLGAGGLAAGAIHVLSGPDHLAAVLPLAAARPAKAPVIGMLWGLGHGLGVLVVGAAAQLLRQAIDLDVVSSWAEAAVGVLLVLIGYRAIRQSRLIVIHSHRHDHEGHVHAHAHVHVGSLAHDASAPAPSAHRDHSHSAAVLGAVHGLAGTAHVLGVLPAVALGVLGASIYLGTYLVGAVVAMTAFAAGARLLLQDGRRLRASLRFAGWGAIAVGAVWVATSLGVTH